MGGAGIRAPTGTKSGDMAACTAPPNRETMTRFHSPRSTTTSETPLPTSAGACGHRFQRTNALLVGGDDSPCSEIDCLRARAGSLLSIVPEIAADHPQKK